MRFLLKIAFLLGLVALFLPYGREDENTAGPGLSPLVLLYGAQQAVSDLGGFCERAPAACATGRDALRFAGDRIGDGLALAYALANERMAPADDMRPSTSAKAPTEAGRPDPEVVGSVERRHRPVPANTQAPLPRPYTPPAAAGLGPAPRPGPAELPLAKPAGAPGRAVATASAAGPATRDAAVPGSPKPFRMPAMAGGAVEPIRAFPPAIVPPGRAPLPQAAPRA